MGKAVTGKVTDKMPRPLLNFVVIKNPAKSKTEEEYDLIQKTADKLPKKEQQAYFQKELATLWEGIEILAVGPEVRGVKVGDIAIGTPELMQTAQPTPDGEYLVSRETVFNSVW